MEEGSFCCGDDGFNLFPEKWHLSTNMNRRKEIRTFILQALKKRKRIDAGELIAMVSTSLTVDQWNVRRMLWDITAAGQAEFCPGFKDVLYIDPSNPKYGDAGYE